MGLSIAFGNNNLLPKILGRARIFSIAQLAFVVASGAGDSAGNYFTTSVQRLPALAWFTFRYASQYRPIIIEIALHK